ncbi:MAG: S9 family peptidase [Pyrinomonadaceae bacterium MAG19_C2-C3]|nr:S9 family peptidase [Pyrinomonadaceae bacterium MAG19_C2-C3]
MRSNRLLTFALAMFAITHVAQAQTANRLNAEQFLDFVFVQNPQISPDGKQVVYTRRTPDKINDRYDNELWMVGTDGTRHRFFAKGSSAQWSPDGRAVAYIGTGQPAGSQIFVKYVDTAEETQITRLERAPSNLAWSPDGKSIAFNMIVPTEDKLNVKLPAKPAGAKWIEPPRVVGRLDYRADGAGYRQDGFMHIFTVASDGGTARQLTNGDYHHQSPEWMPDGRALVFSAVRKPDAEGLREASEIYKLDLAAQNIVALTERNGVDQNPTVSPDGKLIAYTGYDSTGNTYTVAKLYVMNADGTGKRTLTEKLDRAPSGLLWSNDSSNVFFTTEDKGNNNLHSVTLKGDVAPKQITTGNHQLFTTSISRDGFVAGTMTGAQQPNDVVVFNSGAPRKSSVGDAASPRRLTQVNDDLLMNRKLGAVEEINYPSVGNMNVQGWIVKPPDFDPTKKYPLMLYIHGGPHAMYGVGFNYEFQLHAAAGYVVLYTNPRGSTGYGQAFGNAINNAYPGEDYDDLMRGVDEVIKRGYIDERNLFVCGGSGGGVLTTWIVGHTDRFAAAVAMKPVVNWYSFVGTTDSFDWYYNFKSLPWTNPEEHIRRSPITYVGNVKTPTMLMTGDLDLRTPLEQTEQYYRALKLRKVPTMMVRLSDEYHGINADFGLRHPSNRLQQMLYLRSWFDKYRKP